MKELEAINRIQDAISDYLHGPARDQVAQALQQNPTPQTVAAILYEPAAAAIKQLEATGRVEIDEDFIFAVVTEGIDYLIEIIEAVDGKVKKPQEFRHTALMEVLMLHGEQQPDDPEEQAAARQRFNQMGEAGIVEEAIGINSRMAKEAGMNPEEMQSEGAAMAAPRRTPVAGGVMDALGGQ